MSWRLAVWEGARPANDSDALHTLEQLQARWLGRDHAAPSPAITGFLSAVKTRWPDVDRNGSGPIASIDITLGYAQIEAPAAAGLATELGLVCFDAQTESLWDSERCLDAILEVEGERTTHPAVSPEDLEWFAREVTAGLAPSGFERVGKAWRITLAGVGGLIEVRWALVGQHPDDPNVRFSLRVRNELIERLLAECPTATPARWTTVVPLHRAIGIRLRASVTDAGELAELVDQLEAAGPLVRAAVARCAEIDALARLGELDYQRHAIARVVEGQARGAVEDLEAVIRRVVPQGRWIVAEEVIWFLDWVETTLPGLVTALGPPRRLAVRWETAAAAPVRRPPLTDEKRRRFGIHLV
ncbi:MAG: hypothetical protein ACRD12_20830 [Acidimicrobiales bacterium]